MTRGPERQATTFVRAHTRLSPVAYVPELRLHLAGEAFDLWERTESEHRGEREPPFWAFAWIGGQALARYVLDHPEQVAGRTVLDVGAGSGLVAIAAAKAGAAEVVAADIDPLAGAAIQLNASANAAAVRVITADVLAEPEPASALRTAPPAVTRTGRPAQVVLCGDMFYERRLAGRVLELLERTQADGAAAFVGDPGRAFLPRSRFALRATYDVPDPAQLEDAAVKATSVYELIR